MKFSIPNSGKVASAFNTLGHRLKSARKKINSQAAHEMKGGDYSSAQKWMDIGRSVADFSERLDAFSHEWKRLTKATRVANGATGAQTPARATVKTGAAETPAWKFCTPALEFLVSNGDGVSQQDILLGLERSMTTILTAKDREPKSPRNAPRWHDALKKAYKHCQREGWIEKRSDGVWKLVLVQPEMEGGRFPLVSNSPFRARSF